MSTQTCRESGFTLLEVLMAFSILAVGILGVNAMLMNAAQGERYAASERTAHRLAVKKLEELRSMGNNPTLVSGKNDTYEMDTPTADKDEKFGAFVIGYKVADTSANNAYLARVTVGWGGACDSCVPGTPPYVDPATCEHKTAVTSVIFTRP